MDGRGMRDEGKGKKGEARMVSANSKICFLV